MGEEIDVRLGASVEGLQRGMADAQRLVADGVGTIGATIGSLGGSLKVVTVLAQTLLAVLAGGAMRDAVTQTAALGQEIYRLKLALGVSAEQASIIADVLSDLGISTETYTGVIQRLTLKLKANEDVFNQYGVKTRDARLHLLDADTVLRNTITTLDRYKEGTDRNTVATELLGRNFLRAGELTRYAERSLKDAASSSAELGLILGDKDVKASQAFSEAQNELGDVMTGISLTVGRSLMPILTDLAKWFREYGPEAIAVTHAALVTLQTVFLIVKTIVMDTLYVLIAFGNIMMTHFITAVNASAKLLRLDGAGALEVLKHGAAETGAEIRKLTNNVLSSITAFEKQFDLISSRGQYEPTLTTKATGTATVPEPADVGAWKEALMAKKEAQGEFYKTDLTYDLAYWREKLGHVGNDKKARIAVLHEIFTIEKQLAQEQLAATLKTFDFELELARNNKEEQVRIATDRVSLMKTLYGEDSAQFIDAERAKTRILREQEVERRKLVEERNNLSQELYVKNIDLEKGHIAFTKELGLISERDSLIRERELDDQIYLSKRNALQANADLYVDDKIAQEKYYADISKLDADHTLQVQTNQQKQVLALKQDWDTVFSAINNAFSTSITGMILGTTTLRKAIQNLAQSIIGEFVRMGVQLVTNWLSTQLALSIITTTQQSAQATAAAAAAITRVIAARLAAVSEVTSYAAVAGAAATASAAAIPFVGWVIAPGAGAAAFAAAMSYQAALLSAEGGAWSIPSDTLALVHKNEMVLPAREAEGLRANIDSGGGQKNVEFHFHGEVIDGNSIRDFFDRHGAEITRTLGVQNRNFMRPKGV